MFLRSTLLLMTCPAPLSHGHPSPSPPHWNATWVPAQITILLHRKPVFGASTLSLAPRGHGILPVPGLQMEAPSPPLSPAALVLSRRPQKPTPGQEEDLLEGHPVVVHKLDGKTDGKTERPWEVGGKQARGAARVPRRVPCEACAEGPSRWVLPLQSPAGRAPPGTAGRARTYLRPPTWAPDADQITPPSPTSKQLPQPVDCSVMVLYLCAPSGLRPRLALALLWNSRMG